MEKKQVNHVRNCKIFKLLIKINELSRKLNTRADGGPARYFVP